MAADLKALLGILIPYALASSVVGFYSYWNYANLNPFEFVTFEGAMSGAAPIILLAAIAIVPVSAIEIAFPTPRRPDSNPVGEKAKIRFVTIAVAGTNFAMFAFAFSTASYKYIEVFVAGNAVLLACASILGSTSVLNKYINTRAAVRAILFVLCAAPTAALYAAAQRAHSVFLATDYTYFEAQSLKTLDDNLPEARLVYYGRLGDYLFFRINGSVKGYSADAFKYLEFRHSRKTSNEDDKSNKDTH